MQPGACRRAPASHGCTAGSRSRAGRAAGPEHGAQRDMNAADRAEREPCLEAVPPRADVAKHRLGPESRAAGSAGPLRFLSEIERHERAALAPGHVAGAHREPRVVPRPPQRRRPEGLDHVSDKPAGVCCPPPGVPAKTRTLSDGELRCGARYPPLPRDIGIHHGRRSDVPAGSPANMRANTPPRRPATRPLSPERRGNRPQPRLPAAGPTQGHREGPAGSARRRACPDAARHD